MKIHDLHRDEIVDALCQLSFQSVAVSLTAQTISL